MGPEFRAHMALNWTLQGLRDHPGFGTELVTAALQSPSIQNRNGALNVLEAWGFDRWPDDHRHHLSVMAASDPVAKVRERANELVTHRPSKNDPGAHA